MNPENSLEILQILTSIPNYFDTDDLYNASGRTAEEKRRGDKKVGVSTYAFRGAVVFQMAHY